MTSADFSLTTRVSCIFMVVEKMQKIAARIAGIAPKNAPEKHRRNLRFQKPVRLQRPLQTNARQNTCRMAGGLLSVNEYQINTIYP